MNDYLILIPHEEHRDLYRIALCPTANEAMQYGAQEIQDWCEDSEANGKWDDGIDRIMVVQIIARSEPHWPEQAEVPSRYDLNDKRLPCIWTVGQGGVHETACGESILFRYENWGDSRMRYCPYCGKPIRERLT